MIPGEDSGFRIELGEIEAQLVRNRLVKEAVVLAREDMPGEKRLVRTWFRACGWNGSGAQRGGSARGAEGVLPEYMVPSAFVMLEGLP